MSRSSGGACGYADSLLLLLACGHSCIHPSSPCVLSTDSRHAGAVRSTQDVELWLTQPGCLGVGGLAMRGDPKEVITECASHIRVLIGQEKSVRH